MSEQYLDLMDRLNRQKAELAHWQILEQRSLDNIQTYIQLQNELKDTIESLESCVEQMRFAERPKTFFMRMLSR
jgi:hypothetical protein